MWHSQKCQQGSTGRNVFLTQVLIVASFPAALLCLAVFCCVGYPSSPISSHGGTNGTQKIHRGPGRISTSSTAKKQEEERAYGDDRLVLLLYVLGLKAGALNPPYSTLSTVGTAVVIYCWLLCV
jgi:hypothetical protein